MINDLIGLSLTPPPSFARPRANVAKIIDECVREFIAEVSGKSSDRTDEKPVTAEAQT